MHKYKYFLVLLNGIMLLFLMFVFPVNYDNNDDQAMYFINSGILSGSSSSNLIHTHVIIGELLKLLYSISNQINWYTLYLQLVQLAAILTICTVLFYSVSVNRSQSFLISIFVLFGYAVLCVVKLQFTVVALLCVTAAILLIQSSFRTTKKMTLTLFFVVLALLIRSDCFFIFIAFNIPVLAINFFKKEIENKHLLLLLMSVIIFLILNYINTNNSAYKSNQTYTYLHALDDIVDKPVIYTAEDLKEFHFTEDDIIMMKARFPASDSYYSGNHIIELSKKIKSQRTTAQLKAELVKFIMDERYMLMVYLLSAIFVLFFVPSSRMSMLLNAIVFLILIFYLATFMRIPHRVTFPVLICVSMINILKIFNQNQKNTIKLSIALLFAIIGLYKYYCTSALIKLHKEYNAKFNVCRNEINSHPDCLFISFYDGFPIEYMNAWLAPKDFFRHKNIIMTGWNAWAPDFKNVLHHHQLQNLTADLKQKKQVFFLTGNEAFLSAYINVMKQRYDINCHFEEIADGFTALQPRKLVFDN